MAVAGTLKTESYEEQLARLQSEVEALREQLRNSQQLATVGTMAAMVAHEFNNILTPIINYAQLARTNPALKDKAIAHAASGGQRASSICRALLDMAGPSTAGPESVNLYGLIVETLTAMARDPAKDGIALALDVPANLSVVTRRVELQHVLLNLLLNARTALLARPGPKRIEISASRDGERFTLRVSDNGIGIPKENLQRVFEPFFTTRQGGNGEARGHGLGLAVCRQITAGMGGEISVISAAGKGTTFNVVLPG